MHRGAFLCAICVLLVFASASAAEYSVQSPTPLYSTSKLQAELALLHSFTEMPCSPADEYEFELTMPIWYENLVSSDINAYTITDENILLNASCDYDNRKINCLQFADASPMKDLNNFYIETDLRTNLTEGNPSRTEIWNSALTCVETPDKIAYELTDSVDVLPAEIEFLQPDENILSGFVVFSFQEVNGVPHYIKLKYEVEGYVIPEASDSVRADGWQLGFDTAAYPDAELAVSAFACDNKQNCSAAVQRIFVIKNTPDENVHQEDNTDPIITAQQPYGAIDETRPEISVRVYDNNAVNVQETTFILDGISVQYSYNPDLEKIYFTPEYDLNTGAHHVYIMVFDYAGNYAESEWQFSVELGGQPPPPQNHPPEIEQVYASKETALSGEEIEFHATASDADNDTLFYFWDFGDGSTSTEQNPKYTYSLPENVEAKQFFVSLTVNDGTEYVNSIFSIEINAPQQDQNAQTDTNQETTPVKDKDKFGEILEGVYFLAALLLILVVIAAVFFIFKRYRKKITKLISKLKKKLKSYKPIQKAEQKKDWAEEQREVLIGARKQFDDVLGRRRPRIDEKLDKTFSGQEKEEIQRLVFLLRPKRGTYSRDEIVKAILGEGYPTKVAEKVVELLYNSRK